MDTYTTLLERTRVPQPSIQRYAVIQIFTNLKSQSQHLNHDSDAGREAITQCLHSPSPSVVDQSVRELCRLVKESHLDPSRALLELQAALEASPSRLVDAFVKALGFIVRFAFSRGARFDSPENHPFVRVLACRSEVQHELVQQVLLFLVHGKQYGIELVCDYLRPLVTYSILIGSSSDASLSSFVKLLFQSLTSLYCSLRHEVNPLFEMLVSCLKYFPRRDAQDLRNIVIAAELLADAHVVVLRHLVKMGMVDDAHLSEMKLVGNLLTLCMDFERHSIGSKPMLEICMRILYVYEDLGLHHVPELLSFFPILTLSELEDEELYLLKFLNFLVKWKIKDENIMDGDARDPKEILLFVFPMINFISSPSKGVKQAASEFLLLLEKIPVNFLNPRRGNTSVEGRSLSGCDLEIIIVRLLKHLLDQDRPAHCFFLNFCSTFGNYYNMENASKVWLSRLGEYATWVAGERKCGLSASQELIASEMPMLLSAVVGVIVFDSCLGSAAMKTLASLSNAEPKLGVALLLAILYYANYLRCISKCCPNMLLEILATVPSLASHPAMLPLVVQTILPIFRKDPNLLLYGTALRLLCMAWQVNDKIFGSLQALLLPESFTEFQSDHNITLAMAASLRDICRKNPDRGVELILSIAVCIECNDSAIKALGFQSLAYLCEADVVDFYSAWAVITKDVKDYSKDPVVAYSLCLLLRWGAMDAEAYSESANNILQILWEVASFKFHDEGVLWKKARITAFMAMNCFEVFQIVKVIPDFRVKAVNLMTSETDTDILQTIEEVEIRIISYEHSVRRRLTKETRIAGTKIEKLVDVLPRLIFSAGKDCNIRELPAAALFCLPFNAKEKQVDSKNISTTCTEYINMLKEIAASLHLSGSILLAILALQSWKSFMQRWLKSCLSFPNIETSSTVLDKTSRAANDILKILTEVAEDSVPRVAENVGLAMASFCMILPPSVHPAKVAAAKVLLSWLFQYEHEHRQWSAAISLGFISSSLHVTDRQLKLQIADALIEVACSSKSSVVKGACGVGLGYSSQGLLTRSSSFEDSSDQSIFVQQEKALLGKIVRTLSSTIQQLSGIDSDILESLSRFTSSSVDGGYTEIASALTEKSCYDANEDGWGVAGLVLGLGTCVGALFRAESYHTMCDIRNLIKFWITQAGSLVSDCSSDSQNLHILLGIGACLALPTVASFCWRVEMMLDTEIDDLLSSYEVLIPKLLLIKTPNVFHQNLLVASCVGAGRLLAHILEEGVLSLDVQRVEDLVGVFKEVYSDTYPHLVHFGGMLGIVNAMGADAGNVIHQYKSSICVPQTMHYKKECSRINFPLLSSSFFENKLLETVQHMFLLAQDSTDKQLQAYAAWAISFLRSHLWSKHFHSTQDCNANDMQNSKPFHRSFSDDSTVAILSSWLMHLDYPKNSIHANTIGAVLRCLSRAPRLPTVDWGAIIRRCMRYETHIAGVRSLRAECLIFSFAHANKFDSLLAFLDELTDLHRFRSLDVVTQSCLLFHMVDLITIFSISRTQKLLTELAEYLSAPLSPYQNYNARQKTLLRLSCWKGFCKCLNETSLDTSEYVTWMEKCMEVLFNLLPAFSSATFSKQDQMDYLEWSECVGCLGKARRVWLLDLLQISAMGIDLRNINCSTVLKKIVAMARLVKDGSFPIAELAKLNSFILNTKSNGMWEAIAEVVAALHAADGSVKRQWLINVLEISCITNYPSTALQFLGLLSGSCCKYMPFLVLDQQAVLIDLPATLSSLLSTSSWQVITEEAVSHLWTSTSRMYQWITSLKCGDEPTSSRPIDLGEIEICNFILPLMLDSCTRLKEHLSLKQQLRLANMII